MKENVQTKGPDVLYFSFKRRAVQTSRGSPSLPWWRTAERVQASTMDLVLLKAHTSCRHLPAPRVWNQWRQPSVPTKCRSSPE